MAVSEARRRARRNARSVARRMQATDPRPAPVRPGRQWLASVTTSRYRGLPGWTPNPVTAFLFLGLIRIIGALRSPISDCDETFNYWEPLHYMLHGYGLQTWEYAPSFALRSYAFLMPYAGIAKVVYAFSFDKVAAFYAIRATQALLHAAAETALYDSAVYRFGKERARVLLVLLLASPGTFRAAGELLPSSFAMVLLTAAFSRWLVGEFDAAVAYVAVASLLGWVYVFVLGIPIALHFAFRRGLGTSLYSVLSISWPLVALMIAIDLRYYNQVVLVPLRHVMYNVFPVSGAGPEIFGVEHWSFYPRNLLLNLPVAAPFAALFPLQAVLQILGARVWGSGREAGARALYLSPMYLLIGMFSSIGHKEERFLAPVYSLMALVAAVSLCDWLSFFVRGLPVLSAAVSDGQSVRRVRTRFGSALIMFATLSVLIPAIILGWSRAYMQIKAYSAPLSVYTRLMREEFRDGVEPPRELLGDVNICVGKEWHRFPGHFFLPGRRFKLRFVKDGFDGILPKYYANTNWASRVEPKGMNMFNKEDPEQWFVPDRNNECHYYVDLDLSHRGSGQVDVNPIPKHTRAVLFAEPFLDTESSPAPWRAYFVPGYTDKLVYGTYTVVKNTDAL